MKHFTLLFCIALLLASCSGNPQPEEPDPIHRKSPIAITSVIHQPTDTYVKIVYGQPYKREREIFGELVPYREVWRTGANEATEMTTTNPIQFNGNRLEAGTYALYSIPRQNQWTIILNDSLGQWGAFEYDKQHDRLRTRVQTEHISQMTEAFTIQFSEIENDSTSIIMRWDTTKVEVPITFIESDTAQTER